jgi:hypothetical protein
MILGCVIGCGFAQQAKAEEKLYLTCNAVVIYEVDNNGIKATRNKEFIVTVERNRQNALNPNSANRWDLCLTEAGAPMGEGCFFEGDFDSKMSNAISVTDTKITFSQQIKSSDGSATFKSGVLDRVGGQLKYTSTNRRGDSTSLMTIDGKCVRASKVF